ncbi:tail fiber protein [Pedobacter glucosidilyticus]|uniref:tail fiber protein n=1 Tax=Pedobacter glucosidilyticus TaxID=1122941 RepID=UPI0026ED2C7B|nr:tail fiber protein [Pedobacter glucosidilyticus]
MNKFLLSILIFFATHSFAFQSSGNENFISSVTFSANYVVGDYIEFVKVVPYDAGASGYYEISISYTRGNIAASSVHLASISHANPSVWREVAMINSNSYITPGQRNFTIDCNTDSANPRFRVRATQTLGVAAPITVNIKVRSINLNGFWTALSQTGNDVSMDKFLPMTDEWNLYVGNNITNEGAKLALKAIHNGNVGIGTSTPDEKLTVKGKIHAEEVRVDLNVPGPDYVFEQDYQLKSLPEIQAFIKENKHLPEVPSAKEMQEKGINLSEMNMLLLKKVEELTLHLIDQNKALRELKDSNNYLIEQIELLKKK